MAAKRSLSTPRFVSALVVSSALFVAGTTSARDALPKAPTKVVDYQISVRLDAEKKELLGHQRLTWTNPSTDSVSDLWFHLYLNAFRNNRSTFYRESGGKLRWNEAAVDGWGWIDLTELRLADGTDLLPALRFEHPDDDNAEDRTVAVVALPTPIAPGAEVVLDIGFTARLPKVFARAGYQGDYFAVTQWFPKIALYERAGLRGRTSGGWNCHQYHANSEFYADFGDYRVELTLPRDLVVGATGRRVERRDNGDSTMTYVYAQTQVHDFAWAADRRFVEIVDTFQAEKAVTADELAATATLLGRDPAELGLRDVEIHLLMQPEHRAQAARHLDAAKFALKWFGLWYGAYPYPTLTIVDPSAGASGSSGVEYPTLFFAGTHYALGFWPFSGIRWLENVTIHEFGHQYWYGLVGSNEFEEAWLDEGFTTYSSAKALDLSYGAESSLFSLLGAELGSVEFDRIPNSLNRRFDRIATPAWRFSRGQYGFNAYSRPAMVLRTLEGMLGQPTFARVMRAYYERFRFGHPRGEDFFAVAVEVSGRDLDSFFAQLVQGTGVFDPAITRVSSEPAEDFRGRIDDRGEPHVVLENEARASERSAESSGERLWHSEIELRQLGEVQLPVEVELDFEGAEPELRVWDSAGPWERLTFDRPERLRAARLDPGGKLALDANRLNNARRTIDDASAAQSLSIRILFWVQNALGWMAM